ncbi:hypothetical protein M569_14579 [Genlisea aurea]|uniref:Uncharacterized protein n=1 Tax=Genlisea aurea TaxID=192259 RepID=S8C736_9LAMI|nr:hypothetical protein M569_14579 [Genlisea aurea]
MVIKRLLLLTKRFPARRTVKPADRQIGGEGSRQGQGIWRPHPVSGIYFPEGHEWVMEDIPKDAASFDCVYWLRSVDGVDAQK